jgi:hypothetical protein
VVFGGTLGYDLAQNVELQAEVEPSSTAFANSPNVTSSPFAAPGAVATTSFTGANGGYHWQAREMSTTGVTTTWQSLAAIGPGEGVYGTPFYTTSSLLSYYRLEGNANDSKGIQNGTAASPTYGIAYGTFGQGASFNGSTSHIAATSTFSGNPAITVSAWIYPATDTIGNGNPYFQIGDRNAYGEFEVFLSADNSGDVRVQDGGSS